MLTESIHSAAIYGVPLIGCDDRYEDRAAAGRQLAELLGRYRGGRGLVLALSPGGVAVAGEVARGLRLPLDIMVVRELHVRPYPEIVAGALSEGGGLCLNAAALRLPRASLADVWHEARRAWGDIGQLVAVYRHGRALPPLGRRPVILVDDALGGGLVQLAAIQALRRAHAQSCVVATPAGAADALARVADHADQLVALQRYDGDAPDAAQIWSRSLGDDDAATLLERCRLRGDER